ncbi:conserved hypothetical protein [Rippkaea orientalis PCC 8801]|uniref:Uncharacterized protein n=1 Tax=Rippkaea orientalis (strain PCC 8801 / RF-1) TaxID=41431 RepID=B7K2S5_RIPO1|nr:FAD-dependent oxidoreductase [Rippkaea orientalis]ACK67626.1 conserved hypothetical protein [Rippkaea orientalis PCC 8801]
MVTQLTTDILVVGGGTGGTAAAIQAARQGAKTILVSEFPWLGGMLTAAGVAAPDGNELAAWQTGLWGAYIKGLRQKQPEGLDNSWVSLFSYHPAIGAQILAEWVHSLPNLHWIAGQVPLEVLHQGNRAIGVRFPDYHIEAKITLDGTELGDILALAEVPHRWGWEWQEEFKEPSAPMESNEVTQRYPVQSPTWVFILQDYGDSVLSSALPSPTHPNLFQGTWENYGSEMFLNYGRLTDNLFMINWPILGNDYGENLDRLIGSESSRQDFLKEAYHHSLNYAGFIQQQLGRRYGLASNIFPQSLENGSFAFYPYYRESRRLQGQITVTERNILPVSGGSVAALPINKQGIVTSIAMGNYANDHHYPGFDFPLQPKSIRWGGRWTGTPFTIPYDALIPKSIDGLLVCEKNISVSHIANGSTRLQPVVMNLGQAAGVAAALSIELNCQPREVPVRQIQEKLLTDTFAPAAVIPLFNLVPEHPQWLDYQRYYLDHPEAYPVDGNCSCFSLTMNPINCQLYQGYFEVVDVQNYQMRLTEPQEKKDQIWQLITVRPEVDQQFQSYTNGQFISVWGRCNSAGNWLIVDHIT